MRIEINQVQTRVKDNVEDIIRQFNEITLRSGDNYEITIYDESTGDTIFYGEKLLK